MNPNEHLQLARQLLVDSNDLWERGRVHLAGEALWGVVNHLADGILKHQRQSDANTGLSERRNQAYHLFAVNPNSLHIYDGWNMAGRLHGHFYSGNLTSEQLDRNREGALLLADNLERVLAAMLPSSSDGY